MIAKRPAADALARPSGRKPSTGGPVRCKGRAIPARPVRYTQPGFMEAVHD